MKLLIIGKAGHGKDTAAELLASLLRMKFASSSLFACERAVFPVLSEKYGYRDIQDCYDDRDDHRIEWRDLISSYNTPDKTRLVREVLRDHDIYVGMRCHEEYEATKHMFDMVLWIDAGFRLPLKQDPSLTIPFCADEMTPICNNFTEGNLLENVVRLFSGAIIHTIRTAA